MNSKKKKMYCEHKPKGLELKDNFFSLKLNSEELPAFLNRLISNSFKPLIAFMRVS